MAAEALAPKWRDSVPAELSSPTPPPPPRNRLENEAKRVDPRFVFPLKSSEQTKSIRSFNWKSTATFLDISSVRKDN